MPAIAEAQPQLAMRQDSALEECVELDLMMRGNSAPVLTPVCAMKRAAYSYTSRQMVPCCWWRCS